MFQVIQRSKGLKMPQGLKLSHNLVYNFITGNISVLGWMVSGRNEVNEELSHSIEMPTTLQERFVCENNSPHRIASKIDLY